MSGLADGSSAVELGARLEQDFERFDGVFVGLYACAGGLWLVPHAARIINWVAW